MASSGLFHPCKLGRGLRFRGVLYMLTDNRFHEDIEKALKDAKSDGYIVTYAKEQRKYDSGYILRMESEDGNIAIPYFAKQPLKTIRPSALGLEWFPSVECVKLKPQDFNIEEKWYSMSEFATKLKDEISKREDLSEEFRGFLVQIMQFYRECSPQLEEALKLFTPKRYELEQIKKNFGELIGPLAIANKRFGLFDEKDLDEEAEVFFPKNGNQPLYDYKLRSKKKGSSILFSAKSGEKCNVVKPGNLVKLINPRMKKILPKECQVIEDLHEHSMNNGPIVACYNLGVEGITCDFKQHWMGNKHDEWEYDYEIYKDFMLAHWYLLENIKKGAKYDIDLKNPTYHFIRYVVEVLLTKEKLDFSIFFDELCKKVNYINLYDVKLGVPQFKEVRSDIRSSNLSLRTKNTTRNSRDKLGLAPPS